MTRGIFLALCIVSALFCTRIQAQEMNIINGNPINRATQVVVPDTLSRPQLKETDLEKIPSLRAQFEKMNSTYTSQDAPSEELLRILPTVQKHQFFGAQLSSQSNSHIHT